MGFQDKVAIITGASSGIGWALARVLAEQKCRVGLLARRAEQLADLAGQVRAAGGTVEYRVADVSQRQPTVNAIRELADALGPVDLLVANAGVGCPTTLEPFEVEQVEKMYRVNVFGVIYAIEAVLPAMLQRGQGHIAGVSSLAAYKGLPGESGYTSSKAALNNFLEGLRIQLRGRGIAVTTICPGFVKTPMTDVNEFHMPWLIGADDAARRIARALARKKKVYNFPWQTTWLMKATRWLPDWLVARVMGKYNEKPPFPKDGI